MVRKSELLYNEREAVDNTGATFSFTGEITPLSIVAIAIKNTDASARTVTFEGLDRNNVYTPLLCTKASTSESAATQTAATVSEVWCANAAPFIGIRCKITSFTGGKLSLTATLVS